MSGKYIMAVTNGSACCNMGLFTSGDLAETERLLLSSFRADGPRFFWEACTGRMDLEEIMDFCRSKHIPVYLLDGDQLTRYGENEQGQFVWKDF